MAAGNDGYWIADLIWGFNGLILMILLLRLYTRIKYTTMYGADDWLNITAFVSILKPTYLAGTGIATDAWCGNRFSFS